VQQARNLALSLGDRFEDIGFPRSRIELHRLVRRRLPGPGSDLARGRAGSADERNLRPWGSRTLPLLLSWPFARLVRIH
jgi:hypothetical protein